LARYQTRGLIADRTVFHFQIAKSGGIVIAIVALGVVIAAVRMKPNNR